MQPNPYEPPADQSRPTTPRRASLGASLLRIGATLAAIGVVVFVWGFVSFTFFMDNYGPPPFWFQLTSLVALALVPVGITIGVVGGAVWLWGKVRGRG
jgi:nitrogen fixation-related uncharacterized protein